MKTLFKRILKALALGVVIAFTSMSIEVLPSDRIIFTIVVACMSLVILIWRWYSQHWRIAYGVVTISGYYVGYYLSAVGCHYLAAAFTPIL